MVKITIITPTVRKDGIKIVRDALLKQDFTEWEWLIGSSFDPEIPEAKWIKDDFMGGFWSLNRVYNHLINASKGTLIISWQDWIWAKPDTLSKFWNNYENTKGIVSAVGDQYESINKWGKPQVKIWSDPRKTLKQGSFYEINPEDVEWNLCAVPKEAMFKIGGFDEELDNLGFGMDGYQVNERLDFAGYKFFIDQSCESYTIRHDRSDFGGEENWNKNNNISNGMYQKRREELVKSGKWPILSYLKK